MPGGAGLSKAGVCKGAMLKIHIAALCGMAALAGGTPATAATINSSCPGLRAALYSARPGDIIKLTSDCESLLDIRNHKFPEPGVTVDLDRRTIGGGLRAWQNSGITFRNGTIKGGTQTNAVDLRGGERMAFDTISFTDAHRGIRIHGTAGIYIDRSRFHGLKAEGMTAFGGKGFGHVRNSSFGDFNPRPTECHVPPRGRKAETMVLGLSRTNCAAAAGTWRDGDHPDAVQVFGGWGRMDVIGNRIVNDDGTPAQTMGWTTHGNGTVDEFNVINNYSLTTFSTGIYSKAGGVISGNTLIGKGVKAKITSVGSAAVCGNRLPDIRNSDFSKSC